MMELFKGLLMEEEGQGMTEYGLILGLLVVAIVGAFVLFGDQIKNLMDAVAGQLTGTTTEINGAGSGE